MTNTAFSKRLLAILESREESMMSFLLVVSAAYAREAEKLDDEYERTTRHCEDYEDIPPEAHEIAREEYRMEGIAHDMDELYREVKRREKAR